MLLISTSPVLQSNGHEAAGSFVHDLAVALSEAGINTAVVTPTEARFGISWGEHASSGFIHYEFNVKHMPLSQLNASSPGDWLTIVRTLQAGSDAVTLAVEDFRPDNVLALWALPSGYWAQKAMARSDFGKNGIWALGSDIWSLGRVPVVRQMLARVLKKADVIFADGYQLASDVEGISGSDCQFMPSARKLPQIEPRGLSLQSPYRIGYLGRWHQNKGTDLLLDGLELLEEKDWNLIQSVKICGGGPMESVVVERVEKLQRAGKPCEVSGYLDKQAARLFYDWADFILLPSRVESVPVVFSDAMQTHRPIVSMPAGDLRMLMEKYQCGECAEQISASDFAIALRTALINGPDFYASKLHAAAAAFDIDQIAQKIGDTFMQEN